MSVRSSGLLHVLLILPLYLDQVCVITFLLFEPCAFELIKYILSLTALLEMLSLRR